MATLLQGSSPPSCVLSSTGATLKGLPSPAAAPASALTRTASSAQKSSPNSAGASLGGASGAAAPRAHSSPSHHVAIRSDFLTSSSYHAALSSSSSACFSGCRVVGRTQNVFITAPVGRHRQRLTVNAGFDLGDWGARDPYPAEVASNFGDKVIGNQGTDHIILIPTSLLGLSERNCVPVPPDTKPISEEQASSLLRKVVGWRLGKKETGLSIWTEWKLKDAEAATTLFDRISAVAEAEGQSPDLHLQDSNIARAELTTKSIGGLCLNDFIFAAKIDKVKTSDLVKKNRFWA